MLRGRMRYITIVTLYVMICIMYLLWIAENETVPTNILIVLNTVRSRFVDENTMVVKIKT